MDANNEIDSQWTQTAVGHCNAAIAHANQDTANTTAYFKGALQKNFTTCFCVDVAISS